MPSKFKLFWSLLWAKIRGAAKWIIGAVIALAILIAALIGLNNQDDKKDDTSNRPEVAQVYEPSISTPLPPDTNGSTTESSGQVAGATTTETYNTTETSNSTKSVATTTPSQTFTAPQTGVDINKPIYYSNTTMGIKATLPAQSIITEKTNSVVFYSKAGTLLYNIDTVRTSDTLSSIYDQLKASTSVSNITKTTFAGNDALQFTNQSFTGYVIVKNNQAYYIIGKDKNLTNITI